ncbi:5'-3' exodeoxyribonuclease [Aureococcus anophagefferens]|nr:5'-3' exodeoxyribonuclease [Aureococcus anophagefferens]
MGVSGLLPMFRGSTQTVHVSRYTHEVVAIDGYAWLHRGVHACASELGAGGASDKHIEFCMGRVALLLHYKVVLADLFAAGPDVSAIDVRSWTQHMFVTMCALAGCDYVDVEAVKNARRLVALQGPDEGYATPGQKSPARARAGSAVEARGAEDLPGGRAEVDDGGEVEDELR